MRKMYPIHVAIHSQAANDVYIRRCARPPTVVCRGRNGRWAQTSLRCTGGYHIVLRERGIDIDTPLIIALVAGLVAKGRAE